MKIGVEMLVDLAAAHLASQAKTGLVVVVHESLRVMPLLEGAASIAYVNLRPMRYIDFRPVNRGLPTFKERLCVERDPEGSQALIERAGIVVARVSNDPVMATRFPKVSPGNKQWWILYGDRKAAGWAHASQLMRSSRVTLIEFGTTRMLVSTDAVDALGGQKSWLPESAARHADALAKLQPQRLSIETSSGHPRLRFVAEPVRWITAGNEWLSHNLLHEGRALFNTRGLGSLIVPWVDRCTLLLLLRNVRDRIDDLIIAVEDQVLRPARVDYTEHGAVLAINQPEIGASRDALLHLELPRSAVPNDGFCDIGALSASVELGG